MPNDNTFLLLEHHECVELWGGAPTACPSGRMPWEILQEEMDVLLREQVAELQRQQAATDGSQAYQNDLIVGAYDSIKFLGKVVGSHERRLVKLGSQPSDGEPS